MNADTFFSETDKQKIADTIEAVEKETAGEVAVMVVDRSDTYPEARILTGILIGGLTTLVITDLFFNDSLWYYIPLAAAFSFLIGWIAKGTPTILRFFIPANRLEERVRERSVRAFYEKGLYKTRDASGVLFFFSLFEHKVWVLADHGIYSKIKPEELQGHAHAVVKGIKQGNAAESLCAEIAKTGKILARHFPIKADDTNELSNNVIIN